MPRGLNFALQSALWLLIVWFLLRSLERLPSREEMRAFAAAGAVPAMLAFAGFFLAALILRALRFGILVRRSAPLDWPEILVAFPWLFMLGAITPFRMGDVARADWVRRRGGGGGHTIGLWIAERATDMLCLVLMGLVGMALAPELGEMRTPLLVLTGIVIAGYLALSVLQPLWSWVLGARAERGLAGLITPVLSGLGYMSRVSDHLMMLALSGAIWAMMGAAFWTGLSLALGAPVPVSMAILCMVLVNFAALISAAPGNIGTYQAAAVAALALYGVGGAEGILVSSALQIAGLAVTLSAGLLARVAMTRSGRIAQDAPHPR